MILIYFKIKYFNFVMIKVFLNLIFFVIFVNGFVYYGVVIFGIINFKFNKFVFSVVIFGGNFCLIF